MPELQVIIVGAGRAGRDFHINAFNAQPETEVVAICDPDEARLKLAEQENHVPHTYTSLKEALENHQPDIVSICSPPQFHLEQAKQAIDSGAHVLLEKPLAVTIQEADQLRRHQLHSGVKLSLVHNAKFQNGVQKALAMVNRGEIGKILHIERTWMRNGHLDRMISDPNFWCHHIPGGRWTETVSHDIYIAYQFLSDMELGCVLARKLNDRWPWLPADEVSLLLKSCQAYLSIRFSANVEDRLYSNMVIHGSKGVLMTDSGSAFKFPFKTGPGTGSPAKQICLTGKAFVEPAASRIRRLSRKFSKKADRGASQDPLRLPRSSGHWDVIEQFVKHIREDAAPPVSWEEAYATMKLVDQIGRGIQAAVEH